MDKDDGPSSGMLILIVVVILMCILIPVFVGVYLASSDSSGPYDDDDDLGYPLYPVDPYDDENYVRVLNLGGRIEVDDQASIVNVTLTHYGGDPIQWHEYQVTVDGQTCAGQPTDPWTSSSTGTTSVGEDALWTLSNAAGTFTVGSSYTVKVIVIEDSSIAWEKYITAMSA